MNKKRTNLPMPHIDVPDLSKSKISNSEQKRIDKLIKEKYVKPIRKRETKYKKYKSSEWFWTKGATLLNILLALIAAITGIISLLK